MFDTIVFEGDLVRLRRLDSVLKTCCPLPSAPLRAEIREAFCSVAILLLYWFITYRFITRSLPREGYFFCLETKEAKIQVFR
jgi:hypothetical protein